MNFNNPYNANMGMPMPADMTGMYGTQGMSTMPYGYNSMMPQVSPSCNNVVQKCFVEEIPYYVGYNTHAVSNLCYIKWSKNG